MFHWWSHFKWESHAFKKASQNVKMPRKWQIIQRNHQVWWVVVIFFWLSYRQNRHLYININSGDDICIKDVEKKTFTIFSVFSWLCSSMFLAKMSEIFNFASDTQTNAPLLEQSVNDIIHHVLTCDYIEITLFKRKRKPSVQFFTRFLFFIKPFYL